MQEDIRALLNIPQQKPSLVSNPTYSEVTSPQVIGSGWDGIKRTGFGAHCIHPATAEATSSPELQTQSQRSRSKKAMETKVALLLVSALIAVAATYPTKDQQQATAAAVTCKGSHQQGHFLSKGLH